MEWTAILAQLNHILEFQLFAIQDTPVTLFSILMFLLVIVGSIVTSRYLRSIVEHKFSDQFEGGLNFTVRRLLHYSILVIGFFIGLEIVGISLSSLTIVAGFLSVGIGFGLQNIASNFISGLILLFERPIKVGDLVTVDDEIGTIESINLRATKVKTVDNIDIIIPNSSFVEENVTNWSHGEEKVRLRCPFGVAYGSDTGKIKSKALQVANNHEEIMDDPDPVVIFQSFGDSALNFELRYWIDNPRKRVKISSEIKFDIDRVFREEDIEMPFPQRDLHIRSNEASFEVADDHDE